MHQNLNNYIYLQKISFTEGLSTMPQFTLRLFCAKYFVENTTDIEKDEKNLT